MHRKMVVTDLDGTLLLRDKTVSDYTISVLNRCKEQGILVALATARSEKATARIAGIVHPDLLILNGGALVKCKDEVLYRRMLPAEVVDEITSSLAACESCASIAMENDEGYYVTWETPFHPDHAHAVRYDFSTPLHQSAYKVNAEYLPAEVGHAIAQRHPQCSLLRFHDGHWNRFAHRDATKLNGIKAAASHLGLDLRDVVAFGDDLNDTEMLAGCGTGVAMANAASDVQAAAKHVCLSNQEDGVARWIEQHLLV